MNSHSLNCLQLCPLLCLNCLSASHSFWITNDRIQVQLCVLARFKWTARVFASTVPRATQNLILMDSKWLMCIRGFWRHTRFFYKLPNLLYETPYKYTMAPKVKKKKRTPDHMYEHKKRDADAKSETHVIAHWHEGPKSRRR